MKLREHVNALHQARAEYHEKSDKLTASETAKEVEKFKKLQQNIQDMLTEGANDCHDCGSRPHGIFHDGTAKPFEIGCLADKDHRVRETLPEDAVEKWNKCEYMPPRPPDTVLATHRDATGLVKSENIVRVQAP
jgi:hypothetical protein